jgi:hypothetical protein
LSEKSPVTRQPSFVAWHTFWTVKKHLILVNKRSSFECSINHLRQTAGKDGQVSFGRVGCGCRIEIPGARVKRGAKTAKSRQKPPKTAKNCHETEWGQSFSWKF